MKGILKTYKKYDKVAVTMATKDGKLIHLPSSLWVFIQEDARRCKRSATKQIEAILTAYYEVESVNLNPEAILSAQSANNFEKPTGKAKGKSADKRTTGKSQETVTDKKGKTLRVEAETPVKPKD